MAGPALEKKLLLISNSVCHGRPYLDHCADAIRQFLSGVTTIAFVPYAAKDWDGYARRVRSALAGFGLKVESVHETGPWPHTLPDSPAVFVGGGNTFRLLKTMQESRLLDQIRRRVLDGMRYMGSSAGANLACPTIKTTNDMPIVQPADFNALGLVSFQINPHYIDADPNSTHMGETRETRIAEFHEENDLTVVGLREGSWIVVDRDRATLHGETGAKIFVKGESPAEWDRQTGWPA
ncbi:MAG: dipeptidase PepE [Acidobacteriia bacterium]|nr:dipeptidase PepE [Terriglobia bacterium]